jgi:hypothetical protein
MFGWREVLYTQACTLSDLEKNYEILFISR